MNAALVPLSFSHDYADYCWDDLGENESFDSGHEEGDKETDEQVSQDEQKHLKWLNLLELWYK